MIAKEPRPFLKWAGGKRQLLPELRRFYPAQIPRYFEPFLGSAAVFFDLWRDGRLDKSTVVLSDQNADLIGCYLRVRDDLDAVVSTLENLAAGHAHGGRRHYYTVRNERFNPGRRQWRAGGGRAHEYPADMAAMLIYLNRTGYNGLFRLNASGEFNVPAGSYERPRIVDADLLRAVSEVLADRRVTIREAPFDEVATAAPGDFVYFDPPYAPLTRTAHFRAYTAGGFGEDDQRRLQELVLGLAKRDVAVLLSNSSAPLVRELYERSAGARAVRLRAHRVPARRAINSDATRRGKIDELLVTNLAARQISP